jgi:hypothetical protein
MVQRIAEALCVLVLALPAIAGADVKTEEKTQLKFEGGLGRMMSMFGGKAMKEGLVSTSALKGDRKLTITGDHGQIVDLNEEKVYDLDMKDRTYRVTTFAELRRRMEEARKKAEQQSRSADDAPAQKPDEKEPQFEIDFDLKETGAKRTINGFDAREIVMTVVAREKGKKLEESGGMVMTTNSWLTPKMPALKELADFDLRYAQKLHGPMLMDAQQMAAALAMYPMLKDAMARMQKEQVALDGMPVLTVMKVEGAQSPEQAAAAEKEAKEEPAPSASPGGLGGMLARRMMRKKESEKKDAPAPSAPGRTTVFTSHHEVLKVMPSATDADVAIPAGFKEKK